MADNEIETEEKLRDAAADFLDGMAAPVFDPRAVEVIARKLCQFFNLDPDEDGFVMMDDGERAWAPMWHDDKARAREILTALSAADLMIREYPDD